MNTPNNEDEDMERFMAFLACDELDQLERAETTEDWEDLMARLEARREGLDAFTCHRYERIIGDHSAIQEMFDFLQLPLGDFSAAEAPF